MSLYIERQGILDTVQDQGRVGFAKWGINASGAADHFASKAANALVGNSFDAAVIEMHYPAATIVFKEECLISITCADFCPQLNGAPLDIWRPVVVPGGSVLRFTHCAVGARAYLAVRGGFDLPAWLSSYSTNLKAKAGGFQGRPLKKGDVLPIGKGHPALSLKSFRPLPWQIKSKAFYAFDENILHFIDGSEWPMLSRDLQQKIERIEFEIDLVSDRMACALRHAPIKLKSSEELISCAVSFGTIQLLPAGNMAILMADHQTTGGYPRIAHIVSADLPKLAQLQPLSKFRLKRISIEEAEKLLLSQSAQLEMIRTECTYKLEKFYRSQL